MDISMKFFSALLISVLRLLRRSVIVWLERVVLIGDEVVWLSVEPERIMEASVVEVESMCCCGGGCEAEDGCGVGVDCGTAFVQKAIKSEDPHVILLRSSLWVLTKLTTNIWNLFLVRFSKICIHNYYLTIFFILNCLLKYEYGENCIYLLIFIGLYS